MISIRNAFHHNERKPKLNDHFQSISSLRFGMLATPPPHEKARKVVLLGDTQVGKTSLINRLINDSEPIGLQPTIGCHCFDFNVDIGNSFIPLQLWDTAGQEIYSSIVPVYTRNAQAALVLFALNDESSFAHLPRWLDLLSETTSPETPIFIVGSKLDLKDERKVTIEQTKEYTKSGFKKYFEISSMTGDGVEDLFHAVAEALMSSSSSNTVQHFKTDSPNSKENSCC